MRVHGPAGRVAGGCLAAVLALSLSACGSSPGSSAGSSKADATCVQVKTATKDLSRQMLALRAGIASRDNALAAAKSLGSAVSAQAGSTAGRTSKDLDALGNAVSHLIATVSDPTAKRHRVSKAAAKVELAAHRFHVACKH